MQYTNPVPFSVRGLTSADSCAFTGSRCSRTNPSWILKDNVFKNTMQNKALHFKEKITTIF